MHRIDPPRRVLAVALAALAGYVDALGFLTAGGYFVSFMSGNTTRLAVNLASDPALALRPAALIAAFVAGVAIGSVVADRADARRKPAVLGLVGAVLTLAAVMTGRSAAIVAPIALAFAMGALNTAFRRNGEIAFGLTYMTGALVRIGQLAGAALGAKAPEGGAGASLLWLGLASGAIIGALAALNAPLVAPWVAAGWALILAALAARLPS